MYIDFYTTRNYTISINYITLGQVLFSWEALYSSIPENISINFFPVLSAPLIVGLNIYYLYTWVALATITSVISHSNFDMSHTAHHKYFNVNFGTTRFFDIMYGTNRW